MNDAIKMQISAFVDGELPDNESELLLRRLCQDGALRQQAADYLLLGRAIRGERRTSGVERLRSRVAAGLDDSGTQLAIDDPVPVRNRLLRPAAGLGIAAAVAAAAIFALQPLDQSSPGGVAPVGIIDIATAGAYTVPDAYLQLHREASSNINAVLTDFRIREGDLDEAGSDDGEQPENTTGDGPDLGRSAGATER